MSKFVWISQGLSAGSMNASRSLDPADKPRDVGVFKSQEEKTAESSIKKKRAARWIWIDSYAAIMIIGSVLFRKKLIKRKPWF